MLSEIINGVEIIAEPKSEAPSELAKLWIGIQIPLLVALRQDNAYRVDPVTALKQLARKHPEAALKIATIYKIREFYESDESVAGWMVWRFALSEGKPVQMKVGHTYSSLSTEK